MRIFLSHNKKDKETARALGSALVLAGADVWFDEWEIRAGDSITGKLNEGLESFDAFLLLWSEHASKSNWVRRELETAIHHVVETGKGRIVPCFLLSLAKVIGRFSRGETIPLLLRTSIDKTHLPIPALLRDFKGQDLNEKDAISRLIGSLLGFHERKELLMAIQDTLHSMELSWHINRGAGPYICCPKCGDEESIQGWEDWDEERDDHYAGLKCVKCGWSDGGEV